MSFHIPAETDILEAIEAAAAPIVFDSPHSGVWYPPDFNFACDAHRLRRAEDTFVDALWEGAKAAGCGYLRAFFPRSFIDVNRALDDIDEALFDAPWPKPVAPGEKAKAGMGLIRRLSLPGEPMYDRLLSVEEGLHRIDAYYRPYHDALDRLLDAAQKRWGAVWHIDCHSMKAYGNAMNVDPGARRADFVLGDRDGTTCGVELRDLIHDFLSRKGYSVAINAPYKGVELIRRHGRPAEGRHAIQVEVNRALFMDEEAIEQTAGFATLQEDLTALIHVLASARAEAPGL